MHALEGAWVQSLVWELRFYVLCSEVKKKEKKTFWSSRNPPFSAFSSSFPFLSAIFSLCLSFSFSPIHTALPDTRVTMTTGLHDNDNPGNMASFQQGFQCLLESTPWLLSSGGEWASPQFCKANSNHRVGKSKKKWTWERVKEEQRVPVLCFLSDWDRKGPQTARGRVIENGVSLFPSCRAQ